MGVVARMWRSATCRWLLLAGLSWSLLLHAWGLRPWGPEIDYTRAGTLGQWVSGIGSLCAVLVAVRSFVEGRRQIEEKARAEEEARLTGVYAWLSLVYDGAGEAGRWQANFNNTTPIPVYFWILRVEGLAGTHFCHLKSGPILPGVMARDVPVDTGDLAPDPGRVARTALTFCDIKGRVWLRDHDGRCGLVGQGVSDPRSHECQ